MLKSASTLLLLLGTALTFIRAETPASVAAAPGVVVAEAAPAPQVEKPPVPKGEEPDLATLAKPVVPPVPTKHVVVYVIPVHDDISKPILYILRRGLKEAIDQKADAVVLDMDTPGGALSVTFDIMEALGNFHGETLTYVNKEAMSAGAFISATTQEIWFAPHAVIGAAAPVSSDGKDIDVTMKQKVVSYLKARVRAISEGKGYRGDVVSAMIDADVELKIGEKVIKPKGELLSLTDTEAMMPYGDPPHALLGAGIAKDIDALLTKKYGAGNFTIKQFQVTWSEELAQYLNAFSSVLMGLGLLAIFIEFKMPTHGGFAAVGVVLLVIFFFGHHVAGLSGNEPLVLFVVGLLLIGVEVFVFPGMIKPGLLGVVCLFASLIWAMADIWPNVPISFSGDLFVRPLLNLGLGLVLAVVFAVALLRFLPRGWIFDRLALAGPVAGTAQYAGSSPESAAKLIGYVGREAIAVTDLRPTGQVEIEGLRFEARVERGVIVLGTKVKIVGKTDFSLLVERRET